jgi:hypothetical protein
MEVAMKSKVLRAVILLGSLLMAGCEPANSLFALYTDEDKCLDDNLIGEWKQVSPTPLEAARWVFLRERDWTVYKTSLVVLGKRGGFLAKGRLVQLGNARFIDFQGDTDGFDDDETIMPFPLIESHMIGRIWIEKDAVRIHFLNSDWVKKQLEEGKLTLAHAGSAIAPILNAPTADLRKFALEHAEDKEAFSENYELARVK